MTLGAHPLVWLEAARRRRVATGARARAGRTSTPAAVSWFTDEPWDGNRDAASIDAFDSQSA